MKKLMIGILTFKKWKKIIRQGKKLQKKNGKIVF